MTAHAPRRLRFRREPVAVHFPESADVPESKEHLDLRTELYLVLRHAFAPASSVGCDQFVYWNRQKPSKCLAPDGFVKLGVPDEPFRSWKTWERGIPDVAIEIESYSDARTWEEKFDAYHELGVPELVRLDPEARPGHRLEVWNLIDGDLVPREVEGDRAESNVLEGISWVVAPVRMYDAGLRVARGGYESFLPTPEEEASARASQEAARADQQAARASQEAARADQQAARANQEAARANQEAARAESAAERIRELEAELARRSGG